MSKLRFQLWREEDFLYFLILEQDLPVRRGSGLILKTSNNVIIRTDGAPQISITDSIIIYLAGGDTHLDKVLYPNRIASPIFKTFTPETAIPFILLALKELILGPMDEKKLPESFEDGKTYELSCP
jgi:hypothetical protein